MKKLLFKILTLTIAVTSMMVGEIFSSKKAFAYCVYNYSNTTITAVQLPLSEDSFKAVIQPDDKKCCPWDEPTCVAEEGRYAKTPFIIYQGNIDSDIRPLIIQDTVTARRVLRKIDSELIPLIQNILSTPGIPTIKSNIAEQIYSPLNKYVSRKKALGVVQTYNGGVVNYNGGDELLGCWIGRCKDQDINVDDTTGVSR